MKSLRTAAQSDPNPLLDLVKKELRLKNDAALCRTLKCAPPMLSKIRKRKLPVSDWLLISMHEETDISIRDLKSFVYVTAPATTKISHANI